MDRIVGNVAIVARMGSVVMPGMAPVFVNRVIRARNVMKCVRLEHLDINVLKSAPVKMVTVLMTVDNASAIPVLLDQTAIRNVIQVNLPLEKIVKLK